MTEYPLELLVHDEAEVCPYLPGRTARLPLRMPLKQLTRRQFDQRLEQGDRRQGCFLYRTACPTCQACEAIRIKVDEFSPSDTQKRVLRRGEQRIKTRMAGPSVTRRKVALYNQHKFGRNLASGEYPIDAEGYRAFLVDTCCETFEMHYLVDGELIGVAVVDRGQQSLSAVYCYFDPNLGRLSPGTFSILKQISLCQEWGLKYLYLGLFVADSHTMRYKATFRPHQRLIQGEWVSFARESVSPA